MDVVTFGETMIQLNALSVGPLKLVERWETHVAGAESNLAIGIARMGLSSRWISRLGKDGLGEHIYRVIKENGVDVKVKFDEAPTGLYLLWHPRKGESKMKYYRKGSAASKLRQEDLTTELLKDAKWLHLTGITPALSKSCRETCFKACKLARKLGLPISFDINWRPVLWKSRSKARRTFEKIASKSQLVKVGLNNFREIWKNLSIRETGNFLSNRFGCEALVTKKRKSFACNEQKEFEIAPKVEVVDPIGAGDAFMAGYLAAKIKGYSIKKALRIANVVGSLVCTKRGDIEAFPSWKEVENFLSKS